MKAWVLHQINDIRYEEVATPEVSNTGSSGSEVLVKVCAAGICGSDIPRIYETGAHKMPLIPGHEFAGEVADVGEGDEAGWIGKRVGIYPLIPCRKCHSCLQDQYELCRDYDYIGSRRDGAFAE
ncbi:MAG: alcohol dehydrogenase catalytic domain-containing protein, partial [Eubacterium sp.]|nr:alcohol dehydrogenase catalytic domain-containing protein [Eubacterium sp.]